LIDAVLVLALVVVVPRALLLRERAATGEAVAASVAGVVASTSFLLEEGIVAAALVAPWLVATGAFAAREALAWLREPRTTLAMAVGASFLFGGACWLVTSRAGAEPLGFSPAIVELTAVHFHYAGYIAPLVTMQLARRLEIVHSPRDRVARHCVAVILVATPVTAGGITFAPWLGAAGAVLFAAALSTASVLTLTTALSGIDGPARAWLFVSSLSVLVPMGLAVAYALSRWLPTPGPSLRAMVWTHGLLNALGFAVCGVGGWLAVERDRAREPAFSAED
jgi:hypothetical protein